MKIIEYSGGYLNISALNFLEITCKKESKEIISCWLETSNKDIFLFSCEGMVDAENFKKVFFDKLMDYFWDNGEKKLHLNNLIHDTINEIIRR